MTIYFDDLHYLGRSQDFSEDPKWDAAGNRATYQAKDVAGAHDFGFSPTNHAGGKAGEVGGTFWRSGKYAYYADKVGPLSLDDRLEASGKVVLQSGAPDSDMFLGWFNSANKDEPPTAGRALPRRPRRRADAGRPLLPPVARDRQGDPGPGPGGAGPRRRGRSTTGPWSTTRPRRAGTGPSPSRWARSR